MKRIENWLSGARLELELKNALESIPKNSSPDPDGFDSSFFIACWEIIKEDLLDATKDFFSGMALSRLFKASYIVLIPKVIESTSFDKFRLISLCLAVYKIFSKIIVGRLTSCLNRIIFPK